MRQPFTRAKRGRYGHSERTGPGKSGKCAVIERILSRIGSWRERALLHLTVASACRRGMKVIPGTAFRYLGKFATVPLSAIPPAAALGAAALENHSPGVR